MHDPRTSPAPEAASAIDVAAAAPDPLRVATLLRDDDVDAAIDAGLMAVALDDPVLDAATRSLLAAARQRLRAAWDARERHRARAARLARREAEREARRAPVQAQATPPLPAAAAAALARARSKAGRE
ncbi:MAG: hypothetical protein LCH70_05270 [Proteobacteria bacterium]|nr:hypothetical protein [Pseudomonadota bacterium]